MTCIKDARAAPQPLRIQQIAVQPERLVMPAGQIVLGAGECGQVESALFEVDAQRLGCQPGVICSGLGLIQVVEERLARDIRTQGDRLIG